MKRSLVLLLCASCAPRAGTPAAAPPAPVVAATSGTFAGCERQAGVGETIFRCDTVVVHYAESTVQEGVPLERVAVKNASDLQAQNQASKIAVFPRTQRTAGDHEYYAQWLLVNDPHAGKFRIYQALARTSPVHARVLNCTGAKDEVAYRRCEELCDALAAHGPP